MLASGPVRADYLSSAAGLVARLEEKNPLAMDAWDGRPGSLTGVEEFTRDLLELGPG